LLREVTEQGTGSYICVPFDRTQVVLLHFSRNKPKLTLPEMIHLVRYRSKDIRQRSLMTVDPDIAATVVTNC
jgi:hypothetical protein